MLAVFEYLLLMVDHLGDFLGIQRLGFLRLGWFFLLFPALLLVLWRHYSHKARFRWSTVVKRNLLVALIERSKVGEQRQFQFGSTSLAVITICCWVLILCGPYFHQGGLEETDRRQPLVINLAMDDGILSSDMAPSRLALIRLQLEEVLNQYRGSEVALQVFAGSNHQVLPLTTDTDSLIWYLSHLEPDLMPTPGWKPMSALMAGNRLLQRRDMQGQQLLLTTHTDRIGQALADYPEDGVPVVVWAFSRQSIALAEPLPDQMSFHVLRGVDPSLPGLDERFLRNSYKASDSSTSATAPMDLGYYLCWLLLPLTLLWFRQGRLLQWH